MLANSQQKISSTPANVSCYLGLSFFLNILSKQRGTKYRFSVKFLNPVPVTFQTDFPLEKNNKQTFVIDIAELDLNQAGALVTFE